MNSLENVKIRTLKREDLDAIVKINERVLGENRRNYWKRKLELMNDKSSQISLVAEMEGGVVGFVLGDISGWEFGIPETIGWIDTIGVEPAYQKKGVATALARELVQNLKNLGVKTIYTLVSWNDWDLLHLLASIFFLGRCYPSGKGRPCSLPSHSQCSIKNSLFLPYRLFQSVSNADPFARIFPLPLKWVLFAALLVGG
jgi:N-acetylglutamate synthase-like GNAT family acetyltransferase